MLFVISVLTLVSVTFLASACFGPPTPLALSLLLSILEAACICASISPFVLAKPMRFTELILPDVLVSIVEEIAAVAMSQIIEPFALVFVFIFPDVNAVA